MGQLILLLQCNAVTTTYIQFCSIFQIVWKTKAQFIQLMPSIFIDNLVNLKEKKREKLIFFCVFDRNILMLEIYFSGKFRSNNSNVCMYNLWLCEIKLKSQKLGHFSFGICHFGSNMTTCMHIFMNSQFQTFSYIKRPKYFNELDVDKNNDKIL